MFALAGNKWNTTLPGGNMQFQGVIIAETCRIEAGDKQMTVNMGQISSNRFHAVGEDSAPVPFVIHLRECSTVVSERVGVAFHGVADGKNPDVLSVGEGPGIATNIGVALLETALLRLYFATFHRQISCYRASGYWRHRQCPGLVLFNLSVIVQQIM